MTDPMPARGAEAPHDPADSARTEAPAGQPVPAGPAPVVVVQGLTYRDLQRAILLAAALFTFFHFAEALTTLLLSFLLVFILAAVMNPVVVRLERRGVPRFVGAMGLALGVLLFLALLGWLMMPPLLDEIGKFFAHLPEKQSRFTEQYEHLIQRYPMLAGQLPAPGTLLQNLARNPSSLLGQVGRYSINIAVGLFSLLLILVLVVFTVAHPTPLVAGFLGAIPERHRPKAENALRRILEQLKNWAAGSLVLGLIVGTACWIGLRLLSVPYAFLFGVIAGVGELVPNIGPIITAIPPVLVAASNDPMQGLWVVLLFLGIQQAENNLIVPLVMGKSLDLHPLSVTFTVLVMGALFGLLGAVLAVPVCAIIKVLWEEFHVVPSQVDRELLEATARDIVQEGSRNPEDKGQIQNAMERADDAGHAAGRSDDSEDAEPNGGGRPGDRPAERKRQRRGWGGLGR